MNADSTEYDVFSRQFVETSNGVLNGIGIIPHHIVIVLLQPEHGNACHGMIISCGTSIGETSWYDSGFAVGVLLIVVVPMDNSIMVNSNRRHTNPFYVLVVIVGILFTLTASTYGVMTVKQTRPSSRQMPSPLIMLMQRHGLTIMIVELSVLAIATVAAIGTDQYWLGKTAQDITTDNKDDVPTSAERPP